MDQVVADLRPFEADALVADMMPHAGGARGEDGDVRAALALQLELGALDALADLVVAHLQRRRRRHRRLVLDRLSLLLAEAMQVLGLGRVVSVAIDDHGTAVCDDGRLGEETRGKEDLGEEDTSGSAGRIGGMLRSGLDHCQTSAAV